MTAIIKRCGRSLLSAVVLSRFQLWQDYQLRWEPSEFGGITVIRVVASKVWKPDIVLFNKYAVICPHRQHRKQC